MARLVTSGFEFQAIDSAGAGRVEGEEFRTSNTPVIETTIKRSGAASLKCSAAATYARWSPASATTNRGYYARAYVYISATPANVEVLRFETTGGTRIADARLNTDASVGLRYGSGNTLLGSISSPLALTTWHRLELFVNVSSSAGANSPIELRLNGVTVASGTVDVGVTAPGRLHVGSVAGTPGVDLYFDDVALNDDQGSDENSWPGPGKVVLLKPVSDFQRDANWLNGASGTTSLFDALDNRPPTGVAVGSAGATTQIRNAAASSTETYTAETETYSAAGIVPTDRIKVVQAVGAFAWSLTGGDLGSWGLKLDANPSTSEQTQAGVAAAAGTYPAAWTVTRAPVAYAPSLTLGSGAQVKARKDTATNELMACLLGAYVEYNPAVNVDVSTAAITVEGLAPTVSVSGAAGVADVAVAGLSSTPQASIEAPTGDVTVEGLSAGVTVGVEVSAAQIVVEGLEATRGGDATVAVDTASISVEGLSPSVQQPTPTPEGGWVRTPPRKPKPLVRDVFVFVDAPALAWARGYPPTVTVANPVHAAVEAGLGHVWVQGLPPVPSVTIAPDEGHPPAVDTEAEDLEILLLA